MKIKCSYCGKQYSTKHIVKNERPASEVVHKGMGVFSCSPSDMRCQIIKDNLPEIK